MQPELGGRSHPKLNILHTPSQSHNVELSRNVGGFSPSVDVIDAGDHFSIQVEVPGCKLDNLKVEMINDKLEISGKKKNKEKGDGKSFVHHERTFGQFKRQITLPPETKFEDIHSSYCHGVLCICINKKENIPRTHGQRVEIVNKEVEMEQTSKPVHQA